MMAVRLHSLHPFLVLLLAVCLARQQHNALASSAAQQHGASGLHDDATFASRSQDTGVEADDDPNPYGPHTPPEHQTSFQGWYTRINAAHDSSSMAVVVGQYVQNDMQPQPTEHPPVLCMVLLQPPHQDSAPSSAPQPLLAFTRWFTSATIVTTADDKDQLGSINGPNGAFAAGSRVPAFQFLTSSPAVKGHNSIGSAQRSVQDARPTTTAAMDVADGDSSYCKLIVNASKIVLQAHFPGTLSMNVVSTGDRADATPWSPRSATPEGWVGDLGKLVGLHYATLTLATPTNYHMTLHSGWDTGLRPDTSEPNLQETAADKTSADPHDHHTVGIASRIQHKIKHVAEQLGGAVAASVDAAHWGEVELKGQGMAHAEAQYGRGFPPRWLWAQGHSFASGSVRSFVIAGGDLPHMLPAPPIHQYLFSYRDSATGASVAADPWDPPLPLVGIKENVDGCAGVMEVELDTFTHIIQVSMSAPPASFTPVACPSEAGFAELSVESYQAEATITVYRRSAVHSSVLHVLHWSKKLLQRLRGTASRQSDPPSPFQKAAARQKADDNLQADSATVRPVSAVQTALRWASAVWEPQLIVEATFSGAALEYGGKYRCGMGKNE